MNNGNPVGLNGLATGADGSPYYATKGGAIYRLASIPTTNQPPAAQPAR